MEVSNVILPPVVFVYLNSIGEVVVFENDTPAELLLINNNPPVPKDLKFNVEEVVEFSKLNYPDRLKKLKLPLPPANLSITEVGPDYPNLNIPPVETPVVEFVA